MVNAETLTIESGCYLLSIGRKDIFKVLDTDPEIMPSFDYERVVGLEEWVPTYTEKDLFLGDLDVSNFIHYDEPLICNRNNNREKSKIIDDETDAFSQPVENPRYFPIFSPFRIEDWRNIENNTATLDLMPSLLKPPTKSLPRKKPAHEDLGALIAEAMNDSLL